ncbi:MAG: hypothetical protein KGL39_51305, partial [Patescibacteria group bacterium]|nr:hypothetical protein [Patescibacteria group bacterium]
MPITKNLQGSLVETPILDKDQFDRTGVVHDDSFAICDERDRLKQIKFDATNLGTNSNLILAAPASAANSTITITMPSASGTLTTGGISNGFATVQTPAGTFPVATGEGTLTLSSTDSTITITGNSTTDTVNFAAREASASVSGIVSTGTQTFAGEKTFNGNLRTSYVKTSAGSNAIDVNNRQLLNSSGNNIIDWNGQTLSNNGSQIVNWGASSGVQFFNFFGGGLSVTSDGFVTFSYAPIFNSNVSFGYQVTFPNGNAMQSDGTLNLRSNAIYLGIDHAPSGSEQSGNLAYIRSDDGSAVLQSLSLVGAG